MNEHPAMSGVSFESPLSPRFSGLPPGTPSPDALLGNGEDRRVLNRTQAPEPYQVLRMHALALGPVPQAAETAVAEALVGAPASPELHLLRALLRLELGNLAEAADSARRALYLDGNLAIGHYCLGQILRRLGDKEGARRAYRAARNLCGLRPPLEAVALGKGILAGRLAEAAREELELLTE